MNFEDKVNLELGVKKNLWAMGYQYADDGSDSPQRIGHITKNWTRLKEISAGEKFVAYLPPNRFFAIGTVRTPRRLQSIRDIEDDIKHYLDERKPYHKGYVYFRSTVVYENFTDAGAGYPVRIDVEQWLNFVPDGVSVKGLGGIPAYKKAAYAVFPIRKSLFDRIAKRLAAESGSGPKAMESGSMKIAADDSVVEALERGHAKSQGFVLDSKTRKALENYAMEAAKRYFTSLGYVVKDHSAGHPYDLLCTKKKNRLYVEVKGTQTSGDSIILTPGEVRFARRNKGQMALFLVHSINVSTDGSMSNGQENVILPWDVDEGNLKPVSFLYEVPTRIG